MPLTWQLRPLHDRQYYRGGMDEKIQFRRARRRLQPSGDSCQCSEEIRVDFHERGREKLQSVVCRKVEQRRGRTFARLAQERQRTHPHLTLSLPRTDAEKFPHIANSQQDQLMADLLTAAAARERAITGASHDDGARAWERWRKWCRTVGCNDPFLNKFAQLERNLMLGAFAVAVREGRFTWNRTDTLVEGTVRGTISHVVQAFWESGRQNPTKDTDNMLTILLSRQFRAYRNDDPKEKQQKALPFIVLDELAKRQVTELEKAIAQLTIGAAFFACRSCEYLKVPRREMKRTKLLCLCNIRFFKDGQLLSFPSDDLESAESVAVTFEMQKNDQKNDTVIHG
jgi:hypothetical protein